MLSFAQSVCIISTLAGIVGGSIATVVALMVYYLVKVLPRDY